MHFGCQFENYPPMQKLQPVKGLEVGAMDHPSSHSKQSVYITVTLYVDEIIVISWAKDSGFFLSSNVHSGFRGSIIGLFSLTEIESQSELVNHRRLLTSSAWVCPLNDISAGFYVPAHCLRLPTGTSLWISLTLVCILPALLFTSNPVICHLWIQKTVWLI